MPAPAAPPNAPPAMRLPDRLQEGFTLAETLVVTVVLSILAFVVAPQFVGQLARVQEGAAQSQVGTLARLTSSAVSVGGTVVGADGLASTTLTSEAGTINKNGASVYADPLTGFWCISKLAPTGVYYVASTYNTKPQQSYYTCTSPSDAPRGVGQNLLTMNAATGSDTNGTVTDYTPGGATRGSDATQALEGSRSVRVTATTVAARIMVGGYTSNGTIPVVAGKPYTFSAWAKSPTATNSRRACIYWWTTTNTVAATPGTNCGTVKALTTDWQEYSVTANAPANAAFASAAIMSSSGVVVGDTWYEDQFGFWSGNGTWSPPPS